MTAQEPEIRTLESRMTRKCQVRFGGGALETEQASCYRAGALPYLEELPDLEDGDAHEAMSRSSVAAPTVGYRPEPHPRSVVAEAPSSMPGGRGEANGDGKLVCSNPSCGKALTKGQQEVSVRAYGQPLCPACQKIHAKLG